MKENTNCEHELGLYGVCKKCHAWPPALATSEGNAPRETVVSYSRPYESIHRNGSVGVYVDEMHTVSGGGYCPERYKYANIPFASKRDAQRWLDQHCEIEQNANGERLAKAEGKHS